MGSERDRLLEPQTLGTVKLLVQALEARDVSRLSGNGKLFAVEGQPQGLSDATDKGLAKPRQVEGAKAVTAFLQRARKSEVFSEELQPQGTVGGAGDWAYLELSLDGDTWKVSARFHLGRVEELTLYRN